MSDSTYIYKNYSSVKTVSHSLRTGSLQALPNAIAIQANQASIADK